MMNESLPWDSQLDAGASSKLKIKLKTLAEIRVTWTNCPQGQFFEKAKKSLLDNVHGEYGKAQVVFSYSGCSNT